ncbi:MAG: RraA family protein [Bryobacter sp.]|nr:RraA family protein [Bryobacter sp.]
MHKVLWRKSLWITLPLAALVLLGFQKAAKAPEPTDPIVAGLAKSTVASIADAVDQITGSRGYMNFDMRPVAGNQLAGRAITALVRPAPPSVSTPAVATKHSVEMIDNAKPGEVGVILMEGSLDVAAIGGLMGTAAKSRGMAGMVIDGATRDVLELRAMGLPVFARSISPGTAVGRFATVAKNIEVQCGGVAVRPGDIIIGGEDGVVVVPQEKEKEILARAREIDERETKMVPFIQKFKSLSQAIAQFNRI